jgi:N-acylneuraminate cytidylyltransferase
MPLIESEVYADAIEKYDEVIAKGYDSLFTAEEFRRFLWDKHGPLNYEPGVNQVPSQQLEPLYNCVGGIFIAPRTSMISWKYYYGPRPYMYLLDKYASVDIDDETDLVYAKVLYESRHATER